MPIRQRKPQKSPYVRKIYKQPIDVLTKNFEQRTDNSRVAVCTLNQDHRAVGVSSPASAVRQ